VGISFGRWQVIPWGNECCKTGKKHSESRQPVLKTNPELDLYSLFQASEQFYANQILE